MIKEIMDGEKARLPHWGNDKYLCVIRNWKTSYTDKTHVPFIAIVDGSKIGPAILHNCDMFKTDWEIV